ncbi:MAG TPA: hypothetical protein VN783_08140 [Thermoanaerobaculia bacterium]|nr:hypothetical protein [Thermoanaerobaculia bacterium]
MQKTERPEVPLDPSLENFQVTELDEGQLDGVLGGVGEVATNGNCYGCQGSYTGPPVSNGNCFGCGVSSTDTDDRNPVGSVEPTAR